MTELSLNMGAVAEFGAGVHAMADAVRQAGLAVSSGDHGVLAVVLGLVGEEFVDVADAARQSHLTDIDRLTAVIASVGDATRDAHRIYVDAESAVRAGLEAAATAGLPRGVDR
ncbi:hypothetical protein ABH922_002964 [Rhodococcus sp. 27YEA15]|uniref:hypothetical protein n=1 Tax=Rhodococcus sp. 27YEA15 TaxID=3156259 RepID=UPI003C7CBB23